MKKLKKFVTKPHIFFRDALNNKYPIINNEQGIKELDERAVLSHQENLEKLENSLMMAGKETALFKTSKQLCTLRKR